MIDKLLNNEIQFNALIYSYINVKISVPKGYLKGTYDVTMTETE